MDKEDDDVRMMCIYINIQIKQLYYFVIWFLAQMPNQLKNHLLRDQINKTT